MYKIYGADGKEYGPVDSQELRKWITEGRVNAQTQVLASGAAAWCPVSSVPEFSGLFAGAAAPPPLALGPSGQAVKTSALAITSLALGILGCTSLFGLILGIVALIQISKSQGRLGGKGLAIAGVCVSGLVMLLSVPVLAGLLLPALAQAKGRAQSIACINNVKQLSLAMRLYANDNSDTLPKAEKWCDAIINEAGSPRVFICPGVQDGQRSHYAFNAKLSGKKEGEVNPQTVMIFECAGGWNQSGGPGMLQKHHPRSYVIGFVDGSVQSVPEKDLPALRWDP